VTNAAPRCFRRSMSHNNNNNNNNTLIISVSTTNRFVSLMGNKCTQIFKKYSIQQIRSTYCLQACDPVDSTNVLQNVPASILRVLQNVTFCVVKPCNRRHMWFVQKVSGLEL
jgi:hypothetical protein